MATDDNPSERSTDVAALAITERIEHFHRAGRHCCLLRRSACSVQAADWSEASSKRARCLGGSLKSLSRCRSSRIVSCRAILRSN